MPEWKFLSRLNTPSLQRSIYIFSYRQLENIFSEGFNNAWLSGALGVRRSMLLNCWSWIHHFKQISPTTRKDMDKMTSKSTVDADREVLLPRLFMCQTTKTPQNWRHRTAWVQWTRWHLSYSNANCLLHPFATGVNFGLRKNLFLPGHDK